MFVLVRTAHAGHARRWSGPDHERPLTGRGRQQAQGLAHSLSALDVPRLLSSPYLRCRETVEPLAAHTRQQVETTALLGPDARPEEIEEYLVGAGAEGALLCTHGQVLTRLIRHWRTRGSVTFADALALSTGPLSGAEVTEKGGAWIITETGMGRAAHYLRPVHIGPVLDAVPEDAEPLPRQGGAAEDTGTGPGASTGTGPGASTGSAVSRTEA